MTRTILALVLACSIGCTGLTLQAAKDRLREVVLNVEHYSREMDAVCAGLYEPAFDAQRRAMCEDAAAKWIAFDRTWHDLESAVSAAKADPSDENLDRVHSLINELFDREVAFVRAVQHLTEAS